MNQNPFLNYIINKIYYTGEEYHHDDSINQIRNITELFIDLFHMIDNIPAQTIPNKNILYYEINCQIITQEEFINKYSNSLVPFKIYYEEKNDTKNKAIKTSKNIKGNILLSAKRYKYIEVLCKNLDFCIHFGIATPRILDFLSKLNHFDRISNIHLLGTFNVNANIHLLQSSLSNINYTTVLKSYRKQQNKKSFSDNRLYEFLIGTQINKFKITPHFIETLNLYKYENLNVAMNFMTQQTPNPSYLKSILRKRENEEVWVNLDDHIKQSCKDPYLYCLESLYATNTICFSRYFTNPREEESQFFWKHFGITTFYQIFSSLYFYYNIFSHNDLHYGNVLLCSEPGYYFRFLYSMPSKGIDVVFYSPYLVKIIDYARCYVEKTSKYFMEKMRNFSECANKRSVKNSSGYVSIFKYYNKHVNNNRLEDLRILNFIKENKIQIPTLERSLHKKIHEGYKSILEFYYHLEQYIYEHAQEFRENQLQLFTASKIKGTFIIHAPDRNSRDYDSLLHAKKFHFLLEEERLNTKITFFSQEFKTNLWETNHFFYIKDIKAMTNYDFLTKPDFFTYEIIVEPIKLLECKMVLKFNNNSKNNILYEWYMSVIINKFTQLPNTVETFNIYEMNGNQYDNFKESRADNISMQRNMTRVKNYKKIKNRLVDTDKSFFV